LFASVQQSTNNQVGCRRSWRFSQLQSRQHKYRWVEGKEIKWLLKAMSMVKEEVSSRKENHKLTRSSTKLEQRWRG
jgi:hypothetical protein